MKKSIWWVIGIIVVVVAIVSVVSGNSSKNKGTSDAIRIGVSLPLTGSLAFAGEGYKIGLMAAQKKIEAEGGINGKKIDFIIEDNAYDPKISLSTFEKLRTADPDIYIITGSVPASVVSPVAEQADVPVLVSMSFSNTQAKFQNQVSFYPTATEDITATVKTMVANKMSKVAVVYLNSDYGLAMMKVFREQAVSKGIDIVYEDTFLGSDANFQTQLTKAIASKPQAIFVVAINSLPVVKQLKTFKSGITIYTNNPATSGSLIYKDKEAFDGVYATAFRTTIPGTPEFTRIRAEVGTSSPNDSFGYTAAGYDNLMAIAEVLKKNPDAGEFVKTFASYGSFTGINGTFELNSRDVSIPLYPVLFKDGVLKGVK